MFPQAGPNYPTAEENLRTFAKVPGAMAGVIRFCRKDDADVYPVAQTILQEMMKDEQLVDQVPKP